jgi:hypothetical protein
LTVNVAASPAVVTPNGDGVADTTHILVTLSTRAAISVSLVDSRGQTAAKIATGRAAPAGRTALPYAPLVADDAYTVHVEASTPSQHASASTGLVVDRTLARLTASPTPFSPNGDGRRDALAIGFTLARRASVAVRIEHGGATATTLASGTVAAGAQALSWSGTPTTGRAADGRYDIVVTATTQLGTRRLVRTVRLDTRPPALTRVSAVRVLRGTLVRFTLSETARIRVTLAGRTFTIWRRAGARRFFASVRARHVTLSARDRAGNDGTPVSRTVR